MFSAGLGMRRGGGGSEAAGEVRARERLGAAHGGLDWRESSELGTKQEREQRRSRDTHPSSIHLFAERTSPRRPRPGTLAAHQNDALARAAQVAPPEKAGDRLSPKCMRRIRDELDETDDDLPTSRNPGAPPPAPLAFSFLPPSAHAAWLASLAYRRRALPPGHPATRIPPTRPRPTRRTTPTPLCTRLRRPLPPLPTL